MCAFRFIALCATSQYVDGRHSPDGGTKTRMCHSEMRVTKITATTSVHGDGPAASAAAGAW